MPVGRRTRRNLVAAALAVVAVLTSACTTSDDSATGTKGYITGDGTVTVLPPDERPQAPEVAGELLGGGTLDVSTYAAQVVVVNVWGSWCPPCRAEAADLVAASKSLPDAAFVGLDTRDKEAEAEAFVRRYEVPYPSLVDQDSQLLLLFHGIVNLSSVPTTIVIDPDGLVAAFITGATTKTTLVDLVEQIQAGG